MEDIYLTNEYGKLYADAPDTLFESFVYQDKLGRIEHRFIKRKISSEIEDCYDLVTPYGYGGAVIKELNLNSAKEELVNNFKHQFLKYISANNIVSELVRFHPLLNNAQDFKTMYDLKLDRKTVGTNLEMLNPFQTEFSKSARKEIRKLLKNPQIHYQIIDSPKDLNQFCFIYYQTMGRHQATSNYYFSNVYFEKLITSFSHQLLLINVWLEDKIIASGLSFKSYPYLHAHLSGTLNDYLSYSPAYLLKYALLKYGIEHKYQLIHYGGGKTADDYDDLFRFKQKFGKTTVFDFYLGKKIWNPFLYKKLCDERKIELSERTDAFFPAYRQ